jgi:hypothetical protein
MAESVQYGYQILLCDTFESAYARDPNSLVDTFANYTKNFFYKTLGSASDYRLYFVAMATTN